MRLFLKSKWINGSFTKDGLQMDNELCEKALNVFSNQAKANQSHTVMFLHHRLIS